MRRGLVWLAITDLQRSWLRPTLAAAAIALAILAVALFAREISRRQAEVLAGYEEAGASTFMADVRGLTDAEVDVLADALRGLGTVRSVEAPYSSIGLEVTADTSFLVFQNEQQKEYLGARTSVLGTDRSFDLTRDYYVNFRNLNPNAPESILGIPLRVTAGAARAPDTGEMLVASAVADYVGVRPNAQATIELVYTGVEPPIVRRLEGLRLIGTFDAVGPDEGRFDPFWRLAAQGHDVLTVRRSNAPDTAITTLPVVLNIELIREVLASIQLELNSRGVAQPPMFRRGQLIVRANAIGKVPVAEAAVESLLRHRGLEQECSIPRSGSFCLRLPERNNFQAALQERGKLGTGGAFFVTLLLVLIAVSTAGLQVQTVLTRWHDYGVLQALGFSPGQIVGYLGLQLMFVLGGALILATLASISLLSLTQGSLVSLAWAAGVSVIVSSLAALPVLLWPLSVSPAQLIRQAT